MGDYCKEGWHAAGRRMSHFIRDVPSISNHSSRSYEPQLVESGGVFFDVSKLYSYAV